ncbi:MULTISPECIES: hypothetical protein [Enterobacterales]|uniref:hypothetical protein n=1 Tax=Enterobacterales TaxID=91347 RepID=UPI0008481834|nr:MULTISPECIES: hypothetical protein [Enterobacterales]ODQ07453.1 hypothetical protein BGK50_15760 [Shigella sp. FC130]OEI95069.1 hypothetical protein BHE86_14760 [Shigella sp. FC1655]WOO50947.1 hypothetical protein R2S03_07255 [Hafnia alvei]WPF05419.1 hypothetical protein SB028_06105 [Proteus vulgaris]
MPSSVLEVRQEKNWSVYKFFLLLSILIMIQGCAPRSDKNKILSPPADTEWVTVGIKLPEGIEALPLNVLYRSEICQRARYNSAGEKYYISGFNPNSVALKQQGSSDIYQTKIALNGGGSCQWQLSEVWMSIRYKKILNTYNDFEAIPSHKLILIFNNHKYNEGEIIRNLIKNEEIGLNYYPVFINNKIANEKNIILFQHWNRSQYILVNNEKNILFTPLYHKDNITKIDIPKERGTDVIIYYSDGTIEKKPSWSPNYNKLKSLN